MQSADEQPGTMRKNRRELINSDELSTTNQQRISEPLSACLKRELGGLFSMRSTCFSHATIAAGLERMQ